MRLRPIVFAVTAAGLLPGPAFAETKVVTATSPWKMDYTGTACHLQRGFGTTQDPVLVQFEQLAPGDYFNFTVAAGAFSRIAPTSKVALSTGPDHKVIGDRFRLGDMAAGDQKLTTLFFSGTTLNGFTKDGKRPDKVTPERASQVTSLFISWGDKDLQIGMGPLAKAFAAMDTCTEGLVKSWGLDPEQQKALSRRPKALTEPHTWLPAGTFPADLASEGRQALVDVRLLIDATGAVTDCQVVNGYSEPRFAKVTCSRIQERAKFEPALDASGLAVPSYAVHRVNWVIDRGARLIRQRRR